MREGGKGKGETNTSGQSIAFEEHLARVAGDGAEVGVESRRPAHLTGAGRTASPSADERHRWQRRGLVHVHPNETNFPNERRRRRRRRKSPQKVEKNFVVDSSFGQSFQVEKNEEIRRLSSLQASNERFSLFVLFFVRARGGNGQSMRPLSLSLSPHQLERNKRSKGDFLSLFDKQIEKLPAEQKPKRQRTVDIEKRRQSKSKSKNKRDLLHSIGKKREKRKDKVMAKK